MYTIKNGRWHTHNGFIAFIPLSDQEDQLLETLTSIVLPIVSEKAWN